MFCFAFRVLIKMVFFKQTESGRNCPGESVLTAYRLSCIAVTFGSISGPTNDIPHAHLTKEFALCK